MKYLVRWKEFTIKYNIQEKEVNFKNVKKVVVQFERRISIEIERQKNLYKGEKRDFRGELP